MSLGSVEDRLVIYIDARREDAQRTLDNARDVPVSGLVTGPALAGIGTAQLVTAIGLSSIRLAYRQVQREDGRWEYMVWDGLERASRGAATIMAGTCEFFQAGSLLINPVALFYRIAAYANRHEPHH